MPQSSGSPARLMEASGTETGPPEVSVWQTQCFYFKVFLHMNTLRPCKEARDLPALLTHLSRHLRFQPLIPARLLVSFSGLLWIVTSEVSEFHLYVRSTISVTQPCQDYGKAPLKSPLR